MANQCPRCNGVVKRSYSSRAWRVGGLVGILIGAAFGGFNCERCGEIPRSEFPSDVRSKMTLASAGFVLGAIVLLVLVVWLVQVY